MNKPVFSFIILLFAFLSLQVFPQTIPEIEKAFLQNDAGMLHSFFPSPDFIRLSLPAPISFSDQFSDQQAYFFFEQLFSRYTTFEFYTEGQYLFSGKDKSILRARWSFRDKRTNNQYVFRLFFLLEAVPNTELSSWVWNIKEIKAAAY